MASSLEKLNALVSSYAVSCDRLKENPANRAETTQARKVCQQIRLWAGDERKNLMAEAKKAAKAK